MMETVRLDARTIDGRKVAVWRSTGETGGGPAVVLGAGFTRRMRHVGAIALYLTRNGATVYRYDPVDHVGLSDGDLGSFTLTGVERSLAATADLAASQEGTDSLVVVGVSLFARPTLRFAAFDSRVKRVVTLAGVVDVQSTLAQVFGEDYVVMPFDKLPATVQFEGHQAGVRQCYRDVHAHGWADVSGTCADLARIQQPIVAIHASDDQWVDMAEVRRVFGAPENGGPRYLFELPYGEHALERNPVALRIVLTQLTRAVLAPSLEAMEALPVQTPRFEELMALVVADRQRERQESQAA